SCSSPSRESRAPATRARSFLRRDRSRIYDRATAGMRARAQTMNEDTHTTLTQPPARPQRGDVLELQVESLAFGGEGVARLGDTPSGAHGGGYVVFVAGAIPGDRVRAVVHKRKRSY